MNRLACLLLGFLVSAAASAAEPHLQASMVVTGTITVNPDGSVKDYTLHDPDGLPPAVRQIVQATVPAWQFVPVVENGAPVTAEAGMSLRVVADWPSIHAKQATIRVIGAAFGCDARSRARLPDECPPDSTIASRSRKPPRYPLDAVRARVGGEVFLVLEVGRDGHVLQAAARQVNLYSLTDQQARFREMLANASIEAARGWTFKVPAAGPDAERDHWVVTVPINYMIGHPRTHTGTLLRSRSPRAQNEWKAYVPGPVRIIPWDDQDAVSGSTDSIAAGSLFVQDSRLVLKTPLNGSG